MHFYVDQLYFEEDFKEEIKDRYGETKLLFLVWTKKYSFRNNLKTLKIIPIFKKTDLKKMGIFMNTDSTKRLCEETGLLHSPEQTRDLGTKNKISTRIVCCNEVKKKAS